MSILFTQYLRPHGRRTPVEIDMPAEIEALAQRFRLAGGRYECEHLGTTGHASVTACFDDDDVAIEVVPNGPPVVDAVERLVRKSVEWLKARP